jgi:hypothetical protein
MHTVQHVAGVIGRAVVYYDASQSHIGSFCGPVQEF